MADQTVSSWQDVYDLIIAACEHSDEFRKRGASALRFLNRIEAGPVPRPYCDWHEACGDVLWWFVPISEPPYVGSELSSDWFWNTTDRKHLWWTPLPDAKRIEDQVPL